MERTLMAGPIDKFEAEEELGYYEPDLDLDYIARVASELASSLRRGKTAEIAYQPGDGTYYGLVFVPLAAVEAASPAQPGWDTLAVRGLDRSDGHAYLIAWMGHATYGLRLGSRHRDLAVSYVAEKWKTSVVSAGSLALLFRAISYYLDRPQG